MTLNHPNRPYHPARTLLTAYAAMIAFDLVVLSAVGVAFAFKALLG